LLQACLQKGLVLSTQGSTVLLLPALTIDRAVAAKGLDILANCLRKMP
jgi:4-aminobutyrate aminotransferase-like enzyme